MTIGTRGNGRIFDRKRSPFLWCAYHLRGKEYRESTGTADPKQAEKFLKRRLKEVGADQIGAAAFVGPVQERVKVRELLNALEEDYKLRGKASPQFNSHLKHVRKYFGAWRAVEVTAETVDTYIAARLEDGYKPATINRHTQLLTQAFGLAIEREHLSKAPPIRHLSEKGNARQGFFSEADFTAVTDRLPPYYRDFTRFGYLTGWRKGEVASLRWEDFDGEVIRLRGVDSKNEAPRLVLGGELAQLIERRNADRKVTTKTGVRLSAYVFHVEGRPVGDFKKAWHSACVAAGLGGFVCKRCDQIVNRPRCKECRRDAKYVGKLVHDFRRSAVRNMVRAGVPERVAMQVSGHKTRSIFDRYNIVNEEDLRDAMDRTQAYLNNGGQRASRPTVMPIRAAEK
jgi:integrase